MPHILFSKEQYSIIISQIGVKGRGICKKIAAGAGEVVRIEEPTGFTGGAITIYNMQDMTNAICAAAKVGESGRLRDTRDKKIYWVTKLADENCWMTQNLDLDIPVGGLSSTDTDIIIDWNDTTNSTYPPVKTQTGSPSGFNATNNATQGYNVIASYDPGMYIYTNPTTRLDSGCGMLNGVTCQEAGWQNVQGIPSSNLPNQNEVFSSSDEGTYNAHYLVGNYYTFNAATAGKGASVTTSGASVGDSSICPKNWQLPLSGDRYGSNNTVSKSFYYLLDKYGLTSSLASDNHDIRLAPLYFVYGGSIDGSSFNAAGSGGYYRSSTTPDKYNSYYLGFNTGISPLTLYSGRYYGNSVRCVAR